MYLSSKGANLSENDPDIGLSPTKPVKTFEEAKSLLGDGEGQKIIYIVGQVDISAKDEVWEFLDSGYVLKRYLIDADVANGYRGTLIQITQGGSLTLSNIIIDGGGEEGNEDSASKGPIIKVDEGSKLVINEGAYLQITIILLLILIIGGKITNLRTREALGVLFTIKVLSR